MTAEELKLEIEKWIKEQREDLNKNSYLYNSSPIYSAKSSLLNLLQHHLSSLDVRDNTSFKEKEEKEPPLEMISRDAIRGWLWATAFHYGPFREAEKTDSTNGAYEILNSLNDFIDKFREGDY